MDGLIQGAGLIRARCAGYREDSGYHIDEGDNGNKAARQGDFVQGKTFHSKIFTFV